MTVELTAGFYLGQAYILGKKSSRDWMELVGLHFYSDSTSLPEFLIFTIPSCQARSHIPWSTFLYSPEKVLRSGTVKVE